MASLLPHVCPPMLKILVVSATRATAAWLSELLTQDGGAVEALTDGAAAFQRVWDADYDVIVSELGTPGVDGRDLFMAFQNTWPELTRRMVFVCGQPRQEDEAFAVRVGVPLVRGPIDLAALRDALRIVRAQQSVAS